MTFLSWILISCLVIVVVIVMVVVQVLVRGRNEPIMIILSHWHKTLRQVLLQNIMVQICEHIYISCLIIFFSWISIAHFVIVVRVGQFRLLYHRDPSPGRHGFDMEISSSDSESCEYFSTIFFSRVWS